MNLKALRKSYGITQAEASSMVGIPKRTYIRYENSDDSTNLKYQRIVELLKEKCEITETNGVYSFGQLKGIILKVFAEYEKDIAFCYLFGSYAKGYATEKSDVDLCLSTTLSGLKFVGLTEKLREALKKNVDVIRLNDLQNNFELTAEIMKDGIKIYEQHQK